MSVPCRDRVAVSTAALSLALALAMTGTALTAAPSDLPRPLPAPLATMYTPTHATGAHPLPVPTTPAVPDVAP